MISNTLSINQIYTVIFQKTGQPYITEDKDVLIYLKKEDAEKFLKENEGTSLRGPEFVKAEDLCSLCYGAGANQIRIIMPGGKQERKENLLKMPVKKYYNIQLNYNLNMLHETKKKKYLYEFKDSRFIIPIKIDNSSEYIIEYSSAKIKEKKYFLAFSDLREYGIWSEKVNGYEPIEISFDELVELCDGDDVILNIYGSRYVLSQDKIKIIESER